MSEPGGDAIEEAERLYGAALDAQTARSSARALIHLMTVMARLRAPDGCAWDQRQTSASIAPYTIEEAYEVVDAIEREDANDLCDELGDLLLQVVYHARIAEEAGRFAFADAARANVEKMVRRHPHVFGDAVTADWDAIKAAEKAQKADAAGVNASEESHSLLSEVPVALPALSRAVKLQKRAAKVGFDWPTAEGVLDKLIEEARELTEAAAGGDTAHIAEEFGDLLFVMVNLGRRLEVDPEAALRAANAKFTRRFKAIEVALAAVGRRPEDATLEEMEAQWTAAKLAERA